MDEKIVSFLIKLFARIARKDPVEWLAGIAPSAGLDQEQFNKLVEVL